MPFQIYPHPHHFQNDPEFGLGYHIVADQIDVYILFNHEFVLPVDEVLSIPGYLAKVEPTQLESAIRARALQFQADLKPCPAHLFASHKTLQALTSSPSGTVSALPVPPGTPPPAPTPYGHLPFQRSTQTDHERFVRYTTFTNDRRITPTGQVLPGTFAAPASEERLVPTGFSAVGRFALPSLLPAIWRRDIVPPMGTQYLCGAVVPMFGQAGGGVEVKFDFGAGAGSAHLRVATIPEL